MKLDKKYLKLILSLLISQALIYALVKFVQGNPYLVHSYLDDKIPFVNKFVWIYNLWYPYLFVSLYFVYKNNKDQFLHFLFSTALGTIICDIIFIILPTYVVRPAITGTGLSAFLLDVTYYFDTPALNCFPSAHCLFCFIYIITIIFSKNISKTFKAFTIITNTLIILSTLFIKQHSLFDVMGSFIIAIIAYITFNNKGLFKEAKELTKC